jgi:F0F1-type ATP synthase membrane subunit b/b'
MQILNSLGVNYTLWIQLACFLISYVALTSLVLKPYAAALREREKRTFGNEETAVRLIEEANVLHTEYETKARGINAEIKQHYDRSRSEAMKEYDLKIAQARAEAAALLETSRGKIKSEIQAARQQLSGEVPVIGAAIASKLAGKDISL